jgi:hypothetical protein
MGKRMYNSTYSRPRYYFEVSDQLQDSAALSPGKKPLVFIVYEARWALYLDLDDS